jgi:nucleoside-diphosphate-sugar epimerase
MATRHYADQSALSAVAYHQRMRGSKILITGPTGQVATPIAQALAVDNEVWGIARFTNAAAREDLEKAGVRCETVNLSAGDFHGLPTDFDYVINLAVAKSGNWDKDLAANAESVGLLMAHCRGAKAFLHCSSGAVYDPPDDEPRTERAALGDNHKPLFPTYSISKIAGETVARTMARVLGVPTTIARLNVPYGDNGGWPFYQMEMMLAGMPIPVPAGGPARYNPIHEDDIIATIPKLLEVASVPATTVNWSGDQTVSIQEWCGYLGSLVGKEPIFEESEQALRGNPTDNARMRELIGGTTVDWHDGMRRMAAKFHPELVSG